MPPRVIDRFEVILLDMGLTFMFGVGDSRRRDVAGAKGVGLAAVWIRRGEPPTGAESARPGLTIDDLRDLPCAVES